MGVLLGALIRALIRAFHLLLLPARHQLVGNLYYVFTFSTTKPSTLDLPRDELILTREYALFT
jgi:hypothetical protein